MRHTLTAMGQNNWDKQDAKRRRGHHEKVYGNQVSSMIARERSPPPGWRLPLPRHQPGYRPFRELDPEF